MKKYLFTLLIGSLFIFSSCSDYLDVKPKGIIMPENVVDYENILNSPTLTNTYPMVLLNMTDDFFSSYTSITTTADANAYFWRKIITVNEKSSPDIWGPLYRSIYNTNIIINNVMTANEGTDTYKKSVLSEALVMRATYYMDLLTVFTKEYNKSTASTDLGLPMVTSTDVNDVVPDRSSIQTNLDTMISNIKYAIEFLPTTNVNRYRITKYVAYGILSRIYLYMGDYDNAAQYVDLALTAPHTVLNYNDYASSTNAPTYDASTEILWQRASVSGNPIFMLYSDDLKSYFDSNDLRYSLLTVTNNDGLGRSSFTGTYNFGITFPELYLTKAEILARKNNYADAMTLVNDLRKKRIKTAAYTDETASSGSEALSLVLSERRRELAYLGLRWFDMKRLDQEGLMPTVTRVDKETSEVLETLTPHSEKYTFEIPIRVSAFNPNMVLNYSN